MAEPRGGLTWAAAIHRAVRVVAPSQRHSDPKRRVVNPNRTAPRVEAQGALREMADDPPGRGPIARTHERAACRGDKASTTAWRCCAAHLLRS